MRDPINDKKYSELTEFQKKVYNQLEDILFDYKSGELSTDRAIGELLEVSAKISSLEHPKKK